MGRWLALLVGLTVCGAAPAQGADVGLVNLVSGDVTFIPASGGLAKPLAAFSKVRDGDHINVAAGAQVRVVFFDGARQERWAGPASFRARKGGAAAISGKPAEVSALPAEAPRRLARVPELVQYAKLGGIQVRSLITPAQKANLDQHETVARARETYRAMRNVAAAEDITPELFLYAALHDYLLYDEMKTVVEEMLRRQPGSEEAKVFSEFVAAQIARRK